MYVCMYVCMYCMYVSKGGVTSSRKGSTVGALDTANTFFNDNSTSLCVQDFQIRTQIFITYKNVRMYVCIYV